MAIRFDPPTPKELTENIEDLEQRLTVCKVSFKYKGNTLFLYIPAIFPDYDKIKENQPIYFSELNNQIYISLTEPTIKNFTVRKVQWYGNGHQIRYFRVPVPIQLRKKFKLDNSTHAQLINENEKYLCIFL